MPNKHLFYSTSGKLKTFNLPDNTKSIVPLMTSATAPSGIVTSSTSTNPAWTAFDGVTTGNGWLHSGTTNGWFAYEFPTPKVINRYTLVATFQSATNTSPRDWVFQGSNDAVTWDTLDFQTGITSWVQYVKKTFSFKNVKPYKIYRIYCYNNNGGSNYIHIGEIEFFEDFGETTTISTSLPTESDYIKYGVDTVVINPTRINRKKYVTSNKQPLGSGNRYEKSIDVTDDKIKGLIV